MNGWFGSVVVASVAMIAVAPAQAQRAPEQVLSEDDDGRVVRLSVGDEVQVQLSQKSGSAFRWDMRSDSRLRLVAEPQEEAVAGQSIGGRQLRNFRVRVTERGRYPLVFGLRSRSGGPDRIPVRELRYTLEVSAADRRPERWSDWADDRGDRTPGAERAPDGPLREWDAGRVLRVPTGQELTILLPSAVDSGYGWDQVDGMNVSVSRSSTRDFTYSRSNRNIAPEGTAVIRVKVVRRGRANLTLAYRLSGHDGGKPARVLRYLFEGE